MCRELEALYLDGEKSGMEKGRTEGIISSLKSLMATLGMSVEEAGGKPFRRKSGKVKKADWMNLTVEIL